MLVPYNWLKDFISIEVSPERVGEQLSRTTIGVEEVQKIGNEYVLNLEVTYNRGDLLSVIGVARELAALYQLPFHNEEGAFVPLPGMKRLLMKVERHLCPLYILAAIGNLGYKETPKEMQKRLELAGMRSVNLFADITNYVMLEYGQPFHAFDAEKLKARDKTLTIEVRNARQGEKIKTLDGLTRNLNTSDIIIADRKGPIAIAGVMGGQETEVEPGTKEILLEAAIFNPTAIRHTTRRLGLQSEASNRFEHYLSPQNLLKALNKAVKLYQLYGGGRVIAFGCVPHEGSEAHRILWRRREPINLTEEKLNTVLGAKIKISEARQYLRQLGFKVMSSEKGLLAWPPYYRDDIHIEEDLIEEVARLHGYEGLPSAPPNLVPRDVPPCDFEYFRDHLSRILAGMGLNEVKSYPFLSSRSLMFQDVGNLQRVVNPISTETEYLKDSNLLNLVEMAQKNAGRDHEGGLFELEKVYPKDGERFSLSAVAWGTKEPYRTLKGVLETLCKRVHLDPEFIPTIHNLLHPTKTAKILASKKELGIIGELHPHLAEYYQVKSVAVFELNFEVLAKVAQRWGTYTPISKYPEAYEDFSFYFPPEKALGVLISNIGDIHPLIRKTELLDVFEREGRRSVTLRVTFQSDTGELSSNNLTPVRERIIKLIRKSGGNPRV